ncbi:hypothetical protein EUX98_g1038 [Antrodiella citrinella]|uniref:F-box domain-containing protein n=1 Tax=Antrodiella citrinella TaxID=2447956 RepID=A0A4S4N2H5_9APHY|nr:hypothetical protein EUX98_g1038 [Antrodiella citrinella]
MRSTHPIDNDAQMFPIDPFQPLKSDSLLEVSSRTPQVLSSDPSCIDRVSSIMSTGARVTTEQEHTSSLHNTHHPDDLPQDKGKGVLRTPSEPMSILPARVMLEAEYDLFSMSFASAGSSSQMPSPVYTSDLWYPHYTTNEIIHIDGLDGDSSNGADGIGKGKARELPPTLPPLSFTPTEFSYGSAEWPSIAGPSSYGSTFSSVTGPDARTPDMNTTTAPLSTPSTPEKPQAPYRARSLSNLSTRSRRSLSGLSMNKVKVKFSSSNFAKKLFKKRDGSPPSTPVSPSSEPDILGEAALVELITPGLDVLGQSNCFVPWSRDMKPRTPLATPVVGMDVAWGRIDPIYRSPRPTDPHPLRTKGRSYSSPLPLPTSPFDIVPIAPADIFASAPVILQNYFEEILPHELKVDIIAALVYLHEVDHEKRMSGNKWTAVRAGASRNRWVGRDKGVRELFRLSRVSHSWKALVFDGQLWAKLDLRSFPNLPCSVIDHLSKTAGAFISAIDFSGHTGLLPTTIHDLTTFISVRPVLPPGGNIIPIQTHTQLTSINLRGCSLLTTHSLHTLLIRSPSLQTLCVRGLTAVTNTTCEILSTYCSQLSSLDMSRCSNINGDGIHSFARNALEREEFLPMKSLRMSGLKRASDSMMAALGRAAPLLEVLDISGSRDLHNSGVEAFVACSEEDTISFEVVNLSSREAGRDPNDSSRVWRRVTRLRHLSLSSCVVLTDHACSHLAYAVPKLEFLELAGIGPELRDNGVVRLLSTTPFIRRVDLEDATEISDDVLAALTPIRDPSESTPHLRTPPPPEPGHNLEQLIISYTDVTNDSMLSLIRKCPRLTVLEADNTRLAGSALRQFVTLSQERTLKNARIVSIDCRHINESLVKELTPRTRPRLGWRSWHARKLAFLDGRDEEGLGMGQDECDEARVVVKTFYSWQTVDAVRVAREKKRKSGPSRRALNGSSSSGISEDFAAGSSGRARWWSPSGRRSSGLGTPTLLDMNGADRDGCTIM